MQTQQKEVHRCPFWAHYLLASSLRKLVEPADKLLAPHVEPNMTVLDLGCGFGYFTLPLARMVGVNGRIVAVDIEPRTITRLIARARKAGLADRIDARACQAGSLGLKDINGTVDLVVVMHTMHEIADLHGILCEARVLLRPNGRLFVVEPVGHVKEEQFSYQIELCEKAGFHRLPTATIRKRFTALFESPPRVEPAGD
jgi:ubiquinone/menaquinone biosynthesis C-methylase UbiE